MNEFAALKQENAVDTNSKTQARCFAEMCDEMLNHLNPSAAQVATPVK